MMQRYLWCTGLAIAAGLVGCKTIATEEVEGNGFTVLSAEANTRELEKLGCVCESTNSGWTLSSYWLAKDGGGHKRSEKTGQGDVKGCYSLRPTMENRCGEELQ